MEVAERDNRGDKDSRGFSKPCTRQQPEGQNRQRSADHGGNKRSVALQTGYDTAQFDAGRQ